MISSQPGEVSVLFIPPFEPLFRRYVDRHVCTEAIPSTCDQGHLERTTAPYLLIPNTMGWMVFIQIRNGSEVNNRSGLQELLRGAALSLYREAWIWTCFCATEQTGVAPIVVTRHERKSFSLHVGQVLRRLSRQLRMKVGEHQYLNKIARVSEEQWTTRLEQALANLLILISPSATITAGAGVNSLSISSTTGSSTQTELARSAFWIQLWSGMHSSRFRQSSYSRSVLRFLQSLNYFSSKWWILRQPNKKGVHQPFNLWQALPHKHP